MRLFRELRNNIYLQHKMLTKFCHKTRVNVCVLHTLCVYKTVGCRVTTYRDIWDCAWTIITSGARWPQTYLT